MKGYIRLIHPSILHKLGNMDLVHSSRAITRVYRKTSYIDLDKKKQHILIGSIIKFVS